tara:strand:- start:2879 stop:4075 length:1197 start_codon:yes stop_codon:yes gene_type:complete
MKKKYLIIFLSLIIVYLLVNSVINTGNYANFKKKFPEDLKTKIKKYIFPYKYIEQKDDIIKMQNDFNSKIDEINTSLVLKSSFKFTKKNKEELNELRKLIKKDFILDESQIKLEKFENSKFLKRYKINNKISDNNIILYKVNYYSIAHYGMMNFSSDTCESKKLLIYNQGHDGGAYKLNYFKEITDYLFSNCYDILYLNMTGRSFNLMKKKELNFPNIKSGVDPRSHEIYSDFFDQEFSNKKPLSLMLSGNYYLIKKILNENNYTEVIMIGISGGGWYSTVLPSIITEINKSISFAGTIPFVYRVNKKNLGDWEYYESKIFNYLNYIDLYTLNTLDENLEINRKHFQVYNNNDPCCFDGKFVNHFKKSFETKNFYVLSSENEKHSIQKEEFIEILNNN